MRSPVPQNDVVSLPASRETVGWTNSPNQRQRAWHFITAEYPPQPGGVSDYTAGIASALAAAGDEVHVWCKGSARVERSGVRVHAELGNATPSDLRRLGTQLNTLPAPRRLVVQWVPHGYGYRSMNVGFCVWLWNRSVRHGDEIQIMVHEPCLAFGEGSWRQDLAALVHRVMSIALLRAADRVYVSIPQWEQRWRPYTFGKRLPFQWLPIPSNIPVINDAGGVLSLRRKYAQQGEILIGHFGTYGTAVTSILEPVLLELANDAPPRVILLMGIGSDQFRDRMVGAKPELAPRLLATNALAPDDLSRHIAACDLVIQPYPDGVSTRRTSFMLALSHGKPTITTTGHLTEPFWAATDALVLTPAGDTRAFAAKVRELASDPAERRRLGAAAQQLYDQRFDIRHVVGVLRSAGQLQSN